MKPPLFVVGTPRSGTTLTARILNNHSHIFIPGETHYIDDIYSRRDTIGSLSNNESAEQVFRRLSDIYSRYNEEDDQKRVDLLFGKKGLFQDFKAKCNNYSDVYSWFMELQMRHEGKERWGNQVPRDIFNAKDILQIYSDAKFIVCIRDIKDFLLSYKSKWKVAENKLNQKRLRKLYHPIVTSMLWKSSMKSASELLGIVPKNNIIVVKYEDLVTHPYEIVKKICDCLNEDYEHDMLSIYDNNSSFENGQHGIFKTSVGRWKKELAHEEVAAAQLIGSKELRSFNFKIVNIKYNMLKLIYQFITAPIALCRGTTANKEKRGSTITYIINRMRYLLK